MDVGRALRFMFLDPTWPTKLGVAFLILAIPGVWSFVALQSLDAPANVLVGLLAIGASFVGSLLLYSHYSRIIETIAREGRDLPLPAVRPAGEMLERAFTQLGFGLVFTITLIPLLCIVACPIALVASSIQSNGGLIATLIGAILLLLVLGLVIGTYGVIGYSRFVVTGDFGGSLNPGNLVRIFRDDPGAWLTAAFLPTILGIAIAVVREILIAALPNEGSLDDAINTIISVPISAYTTLVAFHLAGQACRLSNRAPRPAAPAYDPAIGD